MTQGISEEVLQIFQTRFRQQVSRALRAFFLKESEWSGLTENDIAERLDLSEIGLTKRLSGKMDLSCSDISDLACAMGGRAELHIVVPGVETLREEGEEK